MKIFKICLFLVLVTNPIAAQNYYYAVEKTAKNNFETTEFSGVANFNEETLYFDSYLLPISRANELQEALDQYGSVRLERGDYFGNPIVMKSGQRLFGHPTISKVPNIYISEGSMNIRVQNIDSYISFNAGRDITNSIFKNIYNTPLECENCQLVNNTFINLDRCRLNLDARQSGYFRNNKFIRHWIHGLWPQIILRGNDLTPSFGNATIWANLLTPEGHAIELDNLDSHTFLGLDAESWNWSNKSVKPMLNANKINELNLVGLSGGNNITHKTPVFDIGGKSINIFSKTTTSNGGGISLVRPGTNVFAVKDLTESYSKENEENGINLKAYHQNALLTLNGQSINSQIESPDLELITQLINPEQRVPWKKPNLEGIPDPLGSNWKDDRLGQKDQSQFIQDLIETNGIAELEAGIYYIGKTLKLKNNQGIIGKGTGQTILVGLTDDFSLITAEGSTSGTRYILSSLTLQGGKTGLQMISKNDNRTQVTSCIFSFLVFRNQEIAVHLDKFYGFDNNFLDNLNFVSCAIGFYQEVDPNYSSGETNTMMYIDKLVFYQNQFINCNTAVSMRAKRADNLIAWINCKFEKNEVGADLKYHNNSFFANCIFENHTGDFVIGGSPIGLYNCSFNANSTNSVLSLREVIIEGCTFLDSYALFPVDKSIAAFIRNSIIENGLGRIDTGMLINSQIGKDLNQPLLVNFFEGRPTTVLNGQANPSPQFLVTH